MTKVPKLFELIKSNDITQKQLADAIGVSQGNISDWNSGRSSPNAETLLKLSNYFSVSVDYLLTGKPSVVLTDAEQEIYDCVHPYDEEAKRDMLLTIHIAEEQKQKQNPPKCYVPDVGLYGPEDDEYEDEEELTDLQRDGCDLFCSLPEEVQTEFYYRMLERAERRDPADKGAWAARSGQGPGSRPRTGLDVLKSADPSDPTADGK